MSKDRNLEKRLEAIDDSILNVVEALNTIVDVLEVMVKELREVKKNQFEHIARPVKSEPFKLDPPYQPPYRVTWGGDVKAHEVDGNGQVTYNA